MTAQTASIEERGYGFGEYGANRYGHPHDDDNESSQSDDTMTDDNTSPEQSAATVPPLEAESTIRNSTAGDILELETGETYTLSEEVRVPPGVWIRGNGATLQPAGDHNVLCIEDDVRLSDLWVDVGDVEGYSSKAITIDTERCGSYHGAGGGVSLDGVFVTGSSDTMGGDGLHINVGPKQWYSANQFHRFGVSGMGNGLHVDVTDSSGGGHVNANRFHCLLWNNGTQIRHSGNGPFESVITGELDATTRGEGTEHMIYNEGSTQRTCKFNGKLYDPFNCSGERLVGHVNINHHGRVHPDIVENSPNAAGMIHATDRDEMVHIDLQSQTSYRQRFVDGWWRFQYDAEGGRNFRDAMSIRADDNQVRVNQKLVTNDMWITGKLTHDLDMGGQAIRNQAEGEPESDPTEEPPEGLLEVEVDGELRYIPYYH